MEKLIVLAKVVVAACVGFGLLIFIVQRRVAFPGTFREVLRPATAVPPDVAQLWLETSFGRVESWFFEGAGEGRKPTLVFAHGNGELIDDWAPAMKDLAAGGVNVLAVEFPGYGHSEGSPTRATIRETFAAAFDSLAAIPAVDSLRIVPYGRSMGGGAAADLARDRPVAALILQSTFTSTMAVARQTLVPGFLVRDRFDNGSVVADFPKPILLLHGPADDVIPYAHAMALAAARPGLEVTPIDCAHNDCSRAWPEILLKVTRFLVANGLLEVR